MKQLLKHIDLLTESTDDYFWLVVRFNRQAAKNLGSGKLKDLEGISGSRKILDWWAGTGKAVLKMQRHAVKKLNRGLIEVATLEPKEFLRDNLRVMKRLTDQPNYGHALVKFIQNYIKPTARSGGDLAHLLARYIENRSFVRYVMKKESAQEVWDWYDGQQPLHQYQALLRRLLQGWMDKEGVPDDEVEQANDVWFKDNYLKKLLTKMRDQYASAEDEYIVSGDVFKVPAGADLFVITYNWSERMQDIYDKRRSGKDDEDFEMLPVSRKKQIEKIAQYGEWINGYGLDERYDLSLVSDVNSI